MRTTAVFSDPPLVAKIVAILESVLGESNVVEVPPVMGGEDFSRHNKVDRPIPRALLWLGAVVPGDFRTSHETGENLPALHSPEFAPLPQPRVNTGVRAMTEIARTLLPVRTAQ